MTPCAMDKLNEADLDRFVSTVRNVLKLKFGMSDSDVDRVAATVLGDLSRPEAATTRAFGDLRYCRDVRRNQVASGLYAVTMGGNLAITLTLLYGMLFDRIAGPLPHALLWATTMGGLALTAYQLRSIIALLGKVAWYGMGPSTQAMLVLTATSLGVMISRIFVKSATGVATVMSLAGILTCLRIYYSAKSAVRPESMYVAAGTAALNRMLTARKISEARAYYTKAAENTKRGDA